MRANAIGGKSWVIGAVLALTFPVAAYADLPANHAPRNAPSHLVASHQAKLQPVGRHPFAQLPLHESAFGSRHAGKGHLVARGGGGGIQCVTFARAASGIEVSGNAADWWNNAAGIYQRGSQPEPGSVLNFRANGRMRLGHVAVVTGVDNSREIEIDHANWSGPGIGRGGVSRNVTVVDVSPNNDWTAVRVALGHGDEFGSVYPTFGFIYGRQERDPAPATTMASIAPIPVLNPPPRDLRPAGERSRMPVVTGGASYDEVAEAPSRHPLDLHAPSGLSDLAISNDAPNRSLR
jgi:surface antigen